MHFISVENSVQKVENPSVFSSYSQTRNNLFILFHLIIQNSVNLLYLDFFVAFRLIWDIIAVF
jgi:hypothetical protein